MLGKRLYALAFLEHGTKRLHITGVTACCTPMTDLPTGRSPSAQRRGFVVLGVQVPLAQDPEGRVNPFGGRYRSGRLYDWSRLIPAVGGA
ncbi:hypothetical protein [Saccharothrix sp. ALI-22-I]|uniref:hypothetical protein n=1 Tax=Saccharothrix sp. ALI-22-I TaxID=1933778 RepID=UPI001EE6F400|nr:hypothetical protein [Saccharothrix sp. ALI-22-I]